MNTMDSSTESQATDSALLNTLIYLDIQDANIKDEMSFGDIIVQLGKIYASDGGFEKYMEKHEDGTQSDYDDRKRQYGILETAAVQNPHMASMVIGNQSLLMTDPSYEKGGLNAFTFKDTEGNITVVYRGTGTGEWLDNGDALSGIAEENTYNTYDSNGNITSSKTVTEYASDQQAEALNYFNRVQAKDGWTVENNITTTGHSKGGNKSQFVDLSSDLVDKCYSFDGQAFSPEAIKAFKDKYGEEAYKERSNKIYSFSAENDPVNQLGVKAMPEDHIYFFEAPESNENMAKNHYMDAMLSVDGHFNKQVEQGELSKLAEALSKVDYFTRVM